jgi:hypothetical protein
MQEFIAKHQEKIAGTLSGFDRLVFRGHLRSIGHPQGMMSYLWTNQVYLKNFGDHVEMVTKRLKEASLAEAKACGRPMEYLNSSQIDKETIARDILAQDNVRSGLVCVLSCLEPCLTFAIHRNRLTKKLELKLSPGKCLFLYHYQIHPVFGFLNARIQTWFPFSIQICLNGREWLARQLHATGLDCPAGQADPAPGVDCAGDGRLRSHHESVHRDVLLDFKNGTILRPSRLLALEA